MLQKIKNHMLLVISALTLLVPVAVPAAVTYAADAGGCSGVPQSVVGGATTASGSSGIGCNASGGLNDSTSTSVGNVAKTLVNIFSVIVGAAAILMIIYAGFRYITSGGSTERIGGAKTTLIYAIIGLVVVALAQILVHFVISASLNAGSQVSQ
jgi:hypothetical protein